MIDRYSRDLLASALRGYVAGQIHNDALDSISVDWRDRGAVAVKQAAWSLYNDHYRHFATGKNAIRGDRRRMVARWILFLHSDREYLWPEYSLERTHSWIDNFVTLGWSGRREARLWKEFCATGDFSSWPFQSEAEVSHEAAKPRFFAGKKAYNAPHYHGTIV